MTTSLRIHTSIQSAKAITGVGERCVTATWKQTQNQDRKERAVIVPMNCLLAPEVPAEFRALVESCLLSAAEQVLKEQQTSQPNNYEILASAFDRPALVESFMNSKDSWMSKEQLDKEFCQGATWKRISGNPLFSTNPQFQVVANSYKEAILKLSAKTSYLAPDVRDQILSKIADEDLGTEFGAFIVRRMEQMKKQDEKSTVNFADL